MKEKILLIAGMILEVVLVFTYVWYNMPADFIHENTNQAEEMGIIEEEIKEVHYRG